MMNKLVFSVVIFGLLAGALFLLKDSGNLFPDETVYLPESHKTCLDHQGETYYSVNKEDRELRCLYKTSRSAEEDAYNSCVNLSNSKVGTFINRALASPSLGDGICTVVYYNPEYKFPKSFEECISDHKGVSAGIGYQEGPSCFINIIKDTIRDPNSGISSPKDKEVAGLLFDKCHELGGDVRFFKGLCRLSLPKDMTYAWEERVIWTSLSLPPGPSDRRIFVKTPSNIDSYYADSPVSEWNKGIPIGGFIGKPASQIKLPDFAFPKDNPREVYMTISSGEDKTSLYNCFVNQSGTNDKKSQLSEIRTINGIDFHFGKNIKTADGSVYSSEIYRMILDNKKCIEITLTVHTIDINDQSSQSIVELDEEKAFPILRAMLSTLRLQRG